MPEAEIQTACPSCQGTMTRLRLQDKSGSTLTLDLCFPCQGIWFDSFESEQLAPESVIALFKLIHAHHDDPRHPLSTSLRCPRCRDSLKACLDMTRSGRFTYQRCLQNHGRFTVFGQFMIEKGFVRQLAPAEITALAARIGSVRCSGCGAPVDIRTQATCHQCGAPIVVLDPHAVDKALAGFQAAATQRRLPARETLADSLRTLQWSQSSASRADLDAADLILSGIGSVIEWLER